MNDRTNTRSDLTPRIYVASLSDYVAGRLHGRWIDANQPVDAIRAEITAMLAESKEPPAEEWAIHDYENFGGLRLRAFVVTGPAVAELFDQENRDQQRCQPDSDRRCYGW